MIKVEHLRIGQKVRHPDYGIGVVKAIAEHSADIQFNDMKRTVSPQTSEIEPAEPTATIGGLDIPLQLFVEQILEKVSDRLGLRRDDAIIAELGARWRGGTLAIRPADASLQPKDIELEVFFHKVVMVRNNLRVLEQKVNASEILSSADKFEWQQYITRCYGSLTTFNLLFKDKEQHF
jgi:hypothetical protein